MRLFTKEEIRELFSETNKAIAELAASQKKTDAQLAKTEEAIERLAARQEKTDAQLAKTDAQLAKTDAQLSRLAVKMDKMNSMYGGLSNNVGEATEELFFNMLNDKPVLNGIRFGPPQRNWHDRVGTCQDEYDIVMKTPKASPGDGVSIFILETKFKATKSDVEKLLTTKKENFNILFPKYKGYDQHWGLAATIIDKKLKDLAVNNGLTVLQYKGGLLVTPPSNTSVIV